MKKTSIITLALALTSIVANASPTGKTAHWLGEKLGGRTLTCEPASHEPAKDPAYRGDAGYFGISVKGREIRISDNGGSGYGFANGSIVNAAHSSETLILTAGDDGSQTLQFDFSNIGYDSEYPNNCAIGVLVSQPELNCYSSENLQCCIR